MTSLPSARFLLTAGAAVVLLPSCRIVNGRMDFFWIQEQFSPAVEDSVVVNSASQGAEPYIAPVSPTIPTPLPTQSAATQAATTSPVAQNQPAAEATPVTQNQPTAPESPAAPQQPASAQPAAASAPQKKRSGWLWWQKAPAPEATPRTYVVAKGDTLSVIARKHGISLRALLQANGIAPENADTLRDGQILNIPTPGVQAAPMPTPQRATTPAPQTQPRGSSQKAPAPAPAPRVYTVLKGDTLTSIARKHGITVPALLQANGIAPENADTLRDGQTLNIPTPTR